MGKITLRIFEFLLAVFIGVLGIGVAVGMVNASLRGTFKPQFWILLPVPAVLLYGGIRLLGFLAAAEVRLQPEEIDVTRTVMAEEESKEL